MKVSGSIMAIMVGNSGIDTLSQPGTKRLRSDMGEAASSLRKYRWLLLSSGRLFRILASDCLVLILPPSFFLARRLSYVMMRARAGQKLEVLALVHLRLSSALCASESIL
jgi:hypothetical protein